MDEDLIREQLIIFVKNHGLKYHHIARKLGVSRSMLSHWKHGRKHLREEKLKKLQQIIN